MNVLFFTDQDVKSLDMCKPNDMAKVGLLDRWSLDR